MLAVMRNPEEPEERRMEMAKAAAPHVHSRPRSLRKPKDERPPVEIARIERVIINPREQTETADPSLLSAISSPP
jgi:hypothetical protein